tara:strand:- start:193 stop:324 length:132 start_codon:yes stop_codon:yes gene_type:complete
VLFRPFWQWLVKLIDPEDIADQFVTLAVPPKPKFKTISQNLKQ